MRFRMRIWNALSTEWAKVGIDFMQEMVQIASQLERQDTGPAKTDATIAILSQPYFGTFRLKASPAQFGPDLGEQMVEAEATLAIPFKACETLLNADDIKGHIAVIQRKDCLFQDKARFAQQAGAVGVVIVDNIVGTSAESSLPFAMSGDNAIEDDIRIPVVFLFHKEGEQLIERIKSYPEFVFRISGQCARPSSVFQQFLLHKTYALKQIGLIQRCHEEFVNVKELLAFDVSIPLVLFNFRFGDLDETSKMVMKQKIVEENIAEMQSIYRLAKPAESAKFFSYVRKIAYSYLGFGTALTQVELAHLMSKLPGLIRTSKTAVRLKGPLVRIICRSVEMSFTCYRLYL